MINFGSSLDDRISGLKFKCLDETYRFECNGVGSKFCTYDFLVCDGIANCPNGEDEDFAECERRGSFSPLANFVCKKKDIFNGSITINAVKCDRNAECENDEDELGCSLPDYVLIIVIAIFLSITIIISFLMWKFTINGLQPINQDKSILEEEVAIVHGDESWKNLLLHSQHLKHSKAVNQAFIKMEIKHHHGDCGNVVVCIKVRTDNLHK